MTVKFVYSEFNAILGNKFNPGGILLPLGIFLFIAINNFPGLLSYVFTSSRHLTFTVRLALPL
jgi:F0F1-type ATP synthase membrane subunit a